MSRLPRPSLLPLSQPDLDWLLRQHVSTDAMVRPIAMMAATGSKGADGRFEYDDTGKRWIAFEQDVDTVFWQPREGSFATETGRAFGLGETVIENPGTYAFDCNLNIFAHPLDWLRAKRDGIVVLDWNRAFDRLRWVPRIAIDEVLLSTYLRAMKPGSMPALFVLPTRGRYAA